MSKSSDFNSLYDALDSIAGYNLYLYPVDGGRAELPFLELKCDGTSQNINMSHGVGQSIQSNYTITIVTQSSRKEDEKKAAYSSLLDAIDTTLETAKITITEDPVIFAGILQKNNETLYIAKIKGKI